MEITEGMSKDIGDYCNTGNEKGEEKPGKADSPPRRHIAKI